MGGRRKRSTGGAPAGLRAAPLAIGSKAYVVFSYPVDDEGGPARRARDTVGNDLTPAERDVGQAILAGLSAAEIATARSRSVSTVNKQIESLYRKLGVHSRSELCARYPVLAPDS